MDDAQHIRPWSASDNLYRGFISVELLCFDATTRESVADNVNLAASHSIDAKWSFVEYILAR